MKEFATALGDRFQPRRPAPKPAVEQAEGFALAGILIALVALTALATGGFLISNADYQVSQNHAAGSRAFQTTDAAMYDHLGTNRRGTDTVAYKYSTGGGSVAGEQLLDLGDGNTLHHLVASAAHRPPEGGTAQRTISLVAMRHDGGLKARAAFLAGSGLHKNGSSGDLDGHDHATSSQCSAGPQPAIAGVAAGPGQYTQNGVNFVPDGDPPLDDTKSGLGHLQSLGLDWAGVVGGTVVAPDFTIPGDTWPNFATLDPNWWPVIYINSSTYSLSSGESGRGTIVATHDLVLTGSFVWDGIILVGGALTSDGKQTVQGTTIAGLNMLLGQTVGNSSIGNGNKEFSYNSCWVRMAAQQFVGGLIEIPGTWIEGM